METPPIHCPNCEREVDDSLTWCPFCGTELPKPDHPSPPAATPPPVPLAVPTEPEPADAGHTAYPPPGTEERTGDPFLDGSAPDGTVGTRPATRSAAPLVAVAGLLVLLGAGAAAFFAFRGGDDAEDLSGDVSVHAMEVGMCWNDPSSAGLGATEVLEVDAVPCSEPHDNEVYALVDYPASGGAPFPGEAAIETAAFDLCRSAFEPFTGTAYEQSILDIFYIYPTLDTWLEGDREIVCSLYRIDVARMVGSQAGAGLRMEGDTVDVYRATDCTGLADLTVEVVSDTIAVFDTLDPNEVAQLTEIPPDLLPAVKSEVLLLNRAGELGCDVALLNDLVSAGVSRLSAQTELGRMILDGIIADGFFVP